ncbi:uncharacterized protein LOC117788070 [Drosophila innubila]|uniref:uncharacterized protein LOC117788070 n=1 Tax=Drosophila innubila TaxID=198719 RepID=UPI00148B42A2|nr:uncharacterized protein LOC117788070 [Drosophila innubila]
MECVCCRCGALQASATATLCLQVSGTQQSYHCHCFCCAQPPRMKCFYCNMWRDLDVLEAHAPCLTGSKHVFVYSEPWPPFSDHTPHNPLRGMVITVGRSQEAEQVQEQVQDHDGNGVDINLEHESAADHVDVHVDSEEVEDLPVEPVDVKPIIATKSKWVSIGDIRNWTSCIRCGMVKIKGTGWIRHAQQCGQDPKYRSRKFFIFLHTLGWCGCLVMDIKWEKHSDPINGTCKVCRESRDNKVPLPYQPKPPARKNEAKLQRQHQARLKTNRKKRRESMAVEAQIRNASSNNFMQIIGATSLHP